MPLEPYSFDEYRTWIVRDDVLSRLEDDDNEVALAERVPHPTVEDIASRNEFVLIMF